VVIPAGALLAAMAVFGIFCGIAGANPFGVYASIRKAAFGSLVFVPNTLVHAAPIMLCALCTAIPMRSAW